MNRVYIIHNMYVTMNSVFVTNILSTDIRHLCEYRFTRFFVRRYCSDKKLQKSNEKSTANVCGENSKQKPVEQVLFEYPKSKYEYKCKPNEKSVAQFVKEDINYYKKYFSNLKNNTVLPRPLPTQYEFIVIGAGPIGTSIAYWLRKLVGNAATVLVIDKDLNRDRFCTSEELAKIYAAKTVGNLKQQYTLLENVQLSKFGAEFIREMDQNLPINENIPATPYKPFGFLSLGSKNNVKKMKTIQANNVAWGVYNELITPYQISQRFPYLRMDGIELGLHGQINEGWYKRFIKFDPEKYLFKLRCLAISYGALFDEAEPIEFLYEPNRGVEFIGFESGHYQPTNNLMVRKPNGEYQKIGFGSCILALGADTGKFTKEMLHIDRRYKGLFQFEVPITRRKRYVYCFESPGGPTFSSPMIVDPTGLYFRREGPLNTYICGCPPLPDEEPDTDNLDVDPNYFTDRVWPLLVNRVPAFEQLRLLSSWARFEECNTLDDNPIIGQHPAYHNVLIAAGFGDRSYQHAAGIGRSFGELYSVGYHKSIDLNRFSFHRVVQEKPVFETRIL